MLARRKIPVNLGRLAGFPAKGIQLALEGASAGAARKSEFGVQGIGHFGRLLLDGGLGSGYAAFVGFENRFLVRVNGNSRILIVTIPIGASTA